MLEQTATPRRLARSESTIAAILRAAADLFVRKNYAEVTMNQIALAAHVTKGALYHHFRGKEELYLAMMRHQFAEKGELFAAALATGTTCRERLGNLVRVFFELPRPQRDVMRLLRRDVNVFAEPTRSRLVEAYQACLPLPVERVVAEGVRTGQLAAADPRLLAWHFVASVEVVLAPYADRVFPSMQDRIEHVVNLFFHGAARAPEAVS